MHAMKLGATVFINTRDLIIRADAFITMENEKSVEQTNATQAEEKKKEPVFGPHGKKRSKISLVRIPILSPYLDKLYQTTFLHGL